MLCIQCKLAMSTKLSERVCFCKIEIMASATTAFTATRTTSTFASACKHRGIGKNTKR